MLLSDGETYRDRRGVARRVTHDPESVGDNYPMVSTCRHYRYTPEGKLLRGSDTPADLVEHVAAKEQGDG